MSNEKPIDIGEKPAYRSINAINGELLRIEIDLKGGEKLTLSDYQSCGKNKKKGNNNVTVWFNS